MDKIIKLADGRRLGYREYGDPNGAPIVYCHGWPSSRLRVSAVDQAAKRAGARIISVDRPGYGLSDYQRGRKILDWPNDVVEIVDQLRLKKLIIVGVSGGGPYAAACAYKIPKRITKVGIVVGLSPTWIPGVLSGMPWLYQVGWQNYSRWPPLAYLAAYFYRLEVKYGYNQTLRIRWKGTDRQVMNKFHREHRLGLLEAFRKGINGPALDLLLYTRDWSFDLTKIAVPVYLWYGEKDRAVPVAMGEYYHHMIPGSRLKIFPGEGHMVSVNHAEEIFKALVSEK